MSNFTSNMITTISLSAENREKKIVCRNLKERLAVYSQRYDFAELPSNPRQSEGVIVRYKPKNTANTSANANTPNTPKRNPNSIPSVFLENDPEKGFIATVFFPISDKFNKQDPAVKLESTKLLFECGCHAVHINPALNPLIPSRATTEQLLWGLLFVQGYNEELKYVKGGTPVEIELSFQQLKDIDIGMRSGRKSSKGKIYFQIMEIYEIVKPHCEKRSGPNSSGTQP